MKHKKTRFFHGLLVLILASVACNMPSGALNTSACTSARGCFGCSGGKYGYLFPPPRPPLLCISFPNFPFIP